MIIGACKVILHLPENHSLKGKRQVLKSIIERVKHRFNVSIAEVDGNDLWQVASLGIVCVSNDSHHVNETLSKVVHFIETTRWEAVMADYEIELLSAC
jgi:hypothetical protein